MKEKEKNFDHLCATGGEDSCKEKHFCCLQVFTFQVGGISNSASDKITHARLPEDICCKLLSPSKHYQKTATNSSQTTITLSKTQRSTSTIMPDRSHDCQDILGCNAKPNHTSVKGGSRYGWIHSFLVGGIIKRSFRLGKG